MASSTSSSVDQAALAQTQQRLEALVAKNPAPDRFFREFVQEFQTLLAGKAGAVWALNQDGVFAPIAELHLRGTGIKENSPAAKLHIQLLLHVLHTGQPLCCTAQGDALAKSPCEETLLLVPLCCQNNCLGVVELFLPADPQEEAVEEIHTALKNLSELAVLYLTRQIESQAVSDQRVPPGKLDSFLLQLHRKLDLEHIGLATVNEGRLLYGCDRVSLAVKQHGKLRVLAVSGHERINHRSTLIRSMTKVADLIAQTGQPLSFDSSSNKLPQSVEQTLLEYMNESGSRQLQGIPLFLPEETIDAIEVKSSLRREVCGVLLLESFDEQPRNLDSRSQQLLCQHISQAIHNAQTFQRGVTQVLWQKLEKFLPTWAASAPRRFALLLGGVAALVTLLMLMPVSYRVEAQGVLVPAIQQGIFAPAEGNVVEVLVQGGERVEQGQILLRMRNDELTMEQLLVRNQLQEKKQLLAALRAESDGPERSVSKEAAIRLRGQISKTQIELEGLEQRLLNLEKSIAELEVKALISGTVASFQPQQQLLHRPVQRGELLLELMAEQGPWKLELDLPANRIGHVQAAAEDSQSEHLPVFFVTSSMPNERHLGYIRKLATRTSVAEDQSAIVKLDVALDPEEVPVRTAGAEVFARIGCGKRCLGYVLFGDLSDFVYRRLW